MLFPTLRNIGVEKETFFLEKQFFLISFNFTFYAIFNIGGRSRATELPCYQQTYRNSSISPNHLIIRTPIIIHNIIYGLTDVSFLCSNIDIFVNIVSSYYYKFGYALGVWWGLTCLRLPHVFVRINYCPVLSDSSLGKLCYVGDP